MPLESPSYLPDVNEDSSFEDILVAYSEVNPEYQNLSSKRVREMIRSVFLDDDNKPLPDKKIRANKSYVRTRVLLILQQIDGNPLWESAKSKKGPDAGIISATDAEFEAADRTFSKTIQEILSPKTERFAFSRDDEDTPDGGKDYSNIVIDPEKITPTLLANLGLEEYIPPKGKRMIKRKKMEFMARAIPQIKEMLSHLEPLKLPHEWHDGKNGKYFRLMRIAAGKNRGYVIGTQVINGKKVFFKADVHSADRRLDHIMNESYEEEIVLLKRIQTTIKRIHSQLGNAWPFTKDELFRAREEMLDCVDKLKHVQNEYKVALRQKIANAVSLKSEREVPAKYKRLPNGKQELVREAVIIEYFNPAAKRAILVTVPKYVGERIREVQQISGFLVRDKVVSRNFICEQQLPFERFYRDVEVLHKKFSVLNLSEPLSERDKQKIIRNLSDLRDQCDPEDSSSSRVPLMQPYLAFGEKMVEHIGRTLELLKSGEESEESRTEIATEFIKTYLVAKIQHFYIQLQSFYRRFLSRKQILNAYDTSLAINTLEAIESLSKVIGQKRVKTTLSIPEYDDIYHKLYKLVSNLRVQARGALELLASDDDNRNELKQIKLFMKAMVINFRFDELFNPTSEDSDSPTQASDQAADPIDPQVDLPLEPK